MFLQPADVMLQRPMKHAIKMGFSNWMVGFGRAQIQNEEQSKVRWQTRRGGLTPRICGWLHENWTGVKGMQSMNVEWWETKFWLAAMEANATTPWFLCQWMEARRPFTSMMKITQRTAWVRLWNVASQTTFHPRQQNPVSGKKGQGRGCLKGATTTVSREISGHNWSKS